LVGVHRGEELVAEVADDELVVASERLDESGRIRRASKREPCEHERGRPPFCACAQLVDQGGRDTGALGPQQRVGFVNSEAEILCTDLADSITDAQSGETERWVDTRGEHQRQFRWTEIDELFDAAVDARVSMRW
jgi:hypothetical protein